MSAHRLTRSVLWGRARRAFVKRARVFCGAEKWFRSDDDSYGGGSRCCWVFNWGKEGRGTNVASGTS